ncbi:MAG: lectin like domain-containing protein [Candidatus Pacebacteria bacterium]|jgi:hypothetical protein|nr:lectin like domain-containing protein [Candidatus Paceibacterota bacterium]
MISLQKMKFPHRSRGAAMMFIIIFFVAISMAIVLGSVNPVTQDLKTSQELVKSKMSYITAESANEDAIYRIKKGKDLSNPEVTVLNGVTATASVVDIGTSQKEITVVADSTNYNRNLNTRIAIGNGFDFVYAVQVGEGGMEMGNYSDIRGLNGLVGNVYSNGPIYGQGDSSWWGSEIHGSAYVAPSIDLDAFWETSNLEQFVGKTSPELDVAQQFVAGFSSPLYATSLYIRKIGNPASATIRIVSDDSNSPGITTLAAQTLSAGSVSTGYGWVDIVFSSPATLTAGQKYWIVFDASEDSANYWGWAKDTNSGYAYGVPKYKDDWGVAGGWTTIDADLNFKNYMEDTTARWTTYNQDQTVGQTSPMVDYAQSFTASTSSPLYAISIYVKKVGSPSSRTMRITTDVSGSPNDNESATATLSSSAVTTSYGWVTMNLSSPVSLTAGQKYWIVLDASQDSGDYWVWGKDSGAGYSGGSIKYSSDWNDNPWSSSSGDFNFKNYVGDPMAWWTVSDQDQFVGKTSPEIDFAQSFVAGASKPLVKVSLYLKKIGSPSNRTIRIMEDNNGSPSSTTRASGSLNSSLVTSNYSWVDVTFSTPFDLVVGRRYWIVFDASQSSSNYWAWGKDGLAGYTNGSIKYTSDYSSPSWVSKTGDFNFRTYLGGGTGAIADVYIHDIANATDVQDSTIGGALYCQTGSGNNKSCDTSVAQLSPVVLPISEGNIADWKAQAEAGGVVNGSCPGTTGCANTMGPKKINGNLSISSGQTLYLSGVLYVTGNVTIPSSTYIKCAPSYGADSCTILSSGWMDINGTVSGSGVDGSFMLVVSDIAGCNGTTSTGCTPNKAAMEVKRDALSGIFYTTKSMLLLEGGVAVQQISGYKVKLLDYADIEYDRGVVNANFVAGPTGGWNVTSWNEAQ